MFPSCFENSFNVPANRTTVDGTYVMFAVHIASNLTELLSCNGVWVEDQAIAPFTD
jgi:hypothetical protein